MRIERLKITDCLGIRLIDVRLSPLTLFAGPNWSGKSSIQQAVRLTLTGEVARVKLKGDYPMVIREGAKAAAIEVELDEATAKARITPSTHQITNPEDTPPALIYLLDPPRFAAVSDTDRRVFLFTALGLSLAREEILARMVEGGAEPAKAESLLPLLRAGFEAAQNEAIRQTSMARAMWKATTGENYGEKKAETWAPAADEETARLIALVKEKKRRANLVAEADDEAAKYEQTVNATRDDLARANARFVCTSCGSIQEPDKLIAAVLTEQLKEQDGALAMLRRALDNRRRDLQESLAASDSLVKLEEDLEARKKKAAEAHENAGKWGKIAELLSPDGIQNEVLANSLKPLNDRLRASAATTGWPQVAVAADMRLLINSRLYGLCSEAERWCADTMIAEAISHLTEIKFVMLDRMDVLGVPRRVELLNWCDQLVSQGTQVVLFATLKEAVAIQGVQVHWLSEGKVAQSFG